MSATSSPVRHAAVRLPPPVRRIEPARGLIRLDLSELWRFRELLLFLVWRDTKVRYKQTFLGFGWALLRPFVTMVIFTVIFGHLVGVKPGTNIPYPLFVFAGILPWLYFASAFAAGAASLLNNVNLVTKTYFPRVMMPLAATLAPLVDLALSFVIFLAMFAWYGRAPSAHAPAVVLFAADAVLAAFGASIWLSAVTVRFRDVPFAIPFITQIWMYATPIIYPVSLVPPQWRWLLAANPLTGVVEGFRWSMLGQGPLHVGQIAVSLAVTLVVAATGLVYFNRVERRFADLI